MLMQFQALNEVKYLYLQKIYLYQINPYPANLLFFSPLEVVSRYRDPQPQVVYNEQYLFILRRQFF